MANEWEVTRTSVLDRARGGDWDEFCRIYSPLVHRMARRSGLSADDSADLAQDVILELLAKIQSFHYDRGRGSFKGYLRTCISRRLIDRLRRVHPKAPLIDEAAADASDPLARMFEAEWRHHHLLAALERVRAEVRFSTYACFQMTVLEERSIPEVAARLGIPNNTVSQNKTRVLKRLREHLKEMEA